MRGAEDMSHFVDDDDLRAFQRQVEIKESTHLRPQPAAGRAAPHRRCEADQEVAAQSRVGEEFEIVVSIPVRDSTLE